MSRPAQQNAHQKAEGDSLGLLRLMRMSWSLLSAPERKRVLQLGAGLVAASVLEAFGVAMIMPFMSLVVPSMARAAGHTHNWWARWWLQSSPDAAIWWVGTVTIVTIVGAAGWNLWVRQALLRFCYQRYHSLSGRLFTHLLAQDYAFFLQRNSSQLIESVVVDCEVVVSKVLLGWLMLVANAALALCITLAVWLVQPGVALAVTAVLGGMYALIYGRLRRSVLAIGQQRQQASEAHARVVQEALVGIRDVKAFGAEAHFASRQSALAAIKADTTASAVLLSEQPRKVIEVLAIGSALTMMMVAALDQSRASDVIPLATLYVFAAYRLLPCAQQVYQQLVKIRFYEPTVELIHDTLAIPAGEAELTSSSTSAEPARAAEARHLQLGLALRQVGFRYPGEGHGAAVSQVTLDIPAGQTVGLVGGTGAGKSTIVGLLLGLLLPEQGQVLADGEPLTGHRRQAWRHQVGYVGQAIHLIDDSVAANIAFGQAHIDMARVEQAAREARIHDTIMQRLPQGYDTRIGDNGVRLSGGERQRLGLARALYGDPDVLLLDEATSALDAPTEQAIMQTIWAMRGRKTIIMVAHRLHTVQACDVIHLLHRGQVVASGSFDSLMNNSAEFEGMVQAQCIDDLREGPP